MNEKDSFQPIRITANNIIQIPFQKLKFDFHMIYTSKKQLNQSFTMSRNNLNVAIIDNNVGQLSLWKEQTQQLTKNKQVKPLMLEFHPAFSPNNQVIVLSGVQSGKSHIVFYLSANLKYLYSLQFRSEIVHQILFSENSLYLYICSEQVIKIFNVLQKRLLGNFFLEENKGKCIAISKNNDELGIGCSNGMCYLKKLYNKQYIKIWKAHNNSIIKIAFSNDGNYLITGEVMILKIWQCNQLQKNQESFNSAIHIIKLQDNLVDLQISSQQQYLIALIFNYCIIIYNLETGLQLQELQFKYHPCLSSDFRVLYLIKNYQI